jgi:hypothetical protein
MSWLTWIWDALSGVLAQISVFLSGLAEPLSQIINTGQGIFSGLATFASAIWDAIYKFGEWIWKMGTESLETLGNWIWLSISSFAQYLGAWLGQLPKAISDIGNWIWSVMTWIYGSLWTVVSTIWNWIFTSIQSFWNIQIQTFNMLANTVNNWFKDLIISFRSKLIQTVKADLALYIGWKGISKLGEEFGLRSLLGAFIAPVGGLVSGEIFGSMLDAMIPSTELDVKLMPTINLPSITVETLTIPEYPYTPTPSPTTPPSIGYGLPYDKELLSTISYDTTTMSKDKEPTEEISVDTSTDSSDGTLEETISYETVVS